jgi:RES domain-containing protein
VPSAVVEQEHNVLINPGHADIVRVTVLEVKDLEFDRRLLKK